MAYELKKKQYEALSKIVGVTRNDPAMSLVFAAIYPAYKVGMKVAELKEIAQAEGAGNLIEVNPHGGYVRLSIEGFAALRAYSDKPALVKAASK